MDPGAPGAIGFAIFKGSILILSLMAAAYPFYRVISMWVDRALDASEALLYLGTLTMLLLGIIATWGTPIGWLLFLALLVGCLGLPLLNRVADNLALRRMEEEDLRKFTAALERQPKNTYLRERLARIFLKRQQYDLALTQMKEALDVDPNDRNLRQLNERIETERRRAVEHLKVCPKCVAENHSEAASCAKCGFLFIDPSDLLRVLWTAPALQAAQWGGVGMLLVGVVLFLMGANPLLITAVGFVAILSIFWYIYARLSRL